MPINVRLDGESQQLLRNVHRECKLLNDQLSMIRQLLETPTQTGKSVTYWRMTLTSVLSYDEAQLKEVKQDMNDWMTVHDVKQLAFIRVDRLTDTFVCRMSDVVISGEEYEKLLTSDRSTLNICGHPWYSAKQTMVYTGKEADNADCN